MIVFVCALAQVHFASVWVSFVSFGEFEYRVRRRIGHIFKECRH